MMKSRVGFRRLCCAVDRGEGGRSALADAAGRVQIDEDEDGGGGMRYPDGSVDEEEGDDEAD